MALTPEMQRKQMVAQQQLSTKQLLRDKIQKNMELLRIASGAHSIQAFGRMSIGAIVLSVVFSFATLIAVLYGTFSQLIPGAASIVYPVLGGFIIVLFYEAVQNLREGFLMFEQSKDQENAALERFIETLLE